MRGRSGVGQVRPGKPGPGSSSGTGRTVASRVGSSHGRTQVRSGRDAGGTADPPRGSVRRAGAGGRSRPIVTTDRGAVRGVRAGSVDSFLGIPYAAAPGGARPVERHRSGAGAGAGFARRRATAAAARRRPAPTVPGTENEDCLFVNVQRPAGLRSGGDRRRCTCSSTAAAWCNGSSNQADCAAIVRGPASSAVTMNYRLGVFGLPRPCPDSAGTLGNYGLHGPAGGAALGAAQHRPRSAETRPG